MSFLFEDKPFEEITWLKELLPQETELDKTRLMKLAIDISIYSAKHGGGPFGAVIANELGHILECGCNEVIHKHDSTAHAEIVTIKRAQKRFKTHDLSTLCNTPIFLYSSCTPCIQCFGAIYWSGISRVFAAALNEDAINLGFNEGHVSKENYEMAKRCKGIEYHLGFLRDEAIRAFVEYKENSGPIY
ncbi:MAG: nucleoside deaminase [Bdellovibrionota bacterium]|jgi:guanine deaminase